MRSKYNLANISSGLTLVEVIVVMTLLGIGVYMLTLLFTTVQGSQRNAYYLTIATNAAKSQVERLKTTSFDNISDGQTFSVPSSLPNGQGVIGVDAPVNAPTSKRVQVTVSYMVGSLPKSVIFTTYIDQPEADPS